MFQLYYALLVLALQRDGGDVFSHVVPSNMDDNPCIVPRRRVGQGGCYVTHSSTRKGAYMSCAVTVKSAPFYFPKVRVTDKKSVHMFSR